MLWLVVLLLALGLVGLFFYFWPNISSIIEVYYLESKLKSLKKAGCQVVRDLVLAGTYIDYLIIAQTGIFVVKQCSFRKKKSYLVGKEDERVWYYYEPYAINQKVPTENIIQGGLVDNANRVPLPNPIIECERAIQAMSRYLVQQDFSLEFHPIILLVPIIEGVNLERKKNSRAQIIFPHYLEDRILTNEVQPKTVVELEKVKELILNSAGIRRAG